MIKNPTRSALDPAEVDFTYDQASSFEDLESGEQLPVVPESFGDEYRKLIAAHVSALGTKFSEHRIDYTMVNTSHPLDRAQRRCRREGHHGRRA